MATPNILNRRENLYPGMKPMSQLPPPPPVKVAPVSGRYQCRDGDVICDFRVDVDKLREFSPVLNKISGTVYVQSGGLWGLNTTSVYFQQRGRNVSVSGSSGERLVTTALNCTSVDGQRLRGNLSATFTYNNGAWSVKLDLGVEQNAVSFTNGEKINDFFRQVKLDIDYAREKVEWPVFELFRLERKPAGMENRKLDAFSAFEDAGVKLEYNENDSQQVSDPTPGTPWNRADLYNVMQEYFDSEEKKSNIWCMMGETPPDQRFMGFSFDRNRMRGFGLFLGHKSFEGFESSNLQTRALAQRRLLHYLVHECGHCLGLKHPFEIGQPNSLSWMNYAWRFDQENGAGSFYQSFLYRFSNDELFILRHSPAEIFIREASSETMQIALGDKFFPRSDMPDETGTNIMDDETMNASFDAAAVVTSGKPERKIDLSLKFKTHVLTVGALLSAEARVKNVGELPVVIERDLNPNSGNLIVSVTTPKGKVKTVESYIRPIKSGFDKPVVLYSQSHKEGTDRISDLVTIGDTTEGYLFTEPGKYTIKAKYISGRYSATTDSHVIDVTEPKSEEDKKTGYKVAEAASLGGSSYKSFEEIKDYFESLSKQSVEEQKGQVASIVELFEGQTAHGSREQKSDTKTKPHADPADALKYTDELVAHYHKVGTKEDNLYYGKLVLKRSMLYLKAKKEQDADKEFNRLLADLVKRHVKHDVLVSLSNDYNEIKNPARTVMKYSTDYLQDKLNKVVSWAPSNDEYGNAKDITGTELSSTFNEFDADQVYKAKQITSMLENKYEETKDLDAVLQYADVLQKGREVNTRMLQYAVRAFAVHSDAAHHAGVKYPPPPPRDMSLFSLAATISIRRKGQAPNEDWMNYWRNDADLNDHHQHWHSVYNAGSGTRPHLLRQGELFGYMHSQMLARYDAERESWGMQTVKPWQYDEIAPAYNAGAEFHNAPANRGFRPRRAQRMQDQDIRQYRTWEANYENAFTTARDNLWQLSGNLNQYYQLDPDWSGHALEASTNRYNSMQVGNLHNFGHGSFGSMTEAGRSSYMMSTVTAIRDPIFFRWHKRIDDLWQRCNDTWFNDLSDGPPVIIDKSDILITHKQELPGRFAELDGDEWAHHPEINSILNTHLAEPTKAFEWDDKLQHDAFFYHIRFRRKPQTSGDLRLTVRVFICPEKAANNRARWIEMDKFVYSMRSGQNSVVLTRSDVMSSVIKRDPNLVNSNNDNDVAETTRGFCECGWPYTLLLPRGNHNGERYKLCVFISDNVKDAVNSRTTCGSMSFCGAQNREYPDVRPMGYPFSTKAVIENRLIENILEDFPTLPHAAMNDFRIKNTEWDETYEEEDEEEDEGEVSGGGVSVPETSQPTLVWPVDVVDDEFPMPTDQPYFPSQATGFFRVLIYDDDIIGEGAGEQSIRVRFKGRGRGNGPYEVNHVSFATRVENLNILNRVDLMVDGNRRFTVPEDGVWSDPIKYNFDSALADYVVTFQLMTGGCGLYKDFTRVNTYVHYQNDRFDNWLELRNRGVRIYATRSLYCVEKIERV